MTDEVRNPGARNFNEVVAEVTARRATAEERRLVDDRAAEYGEDPDGRDEGRDVLPRTAPSDEEVRRSGQGFPGWAKIPRDLVFPTTGIEIAFLRFRPAWTDRPKKGERQCILWSLSLGDEKFARKLSRGDLDATAEYQAMKMIRAVDGERATWAGDKSVGDVELFWDEVGKKCRNLVTTYYVKMHSLSREEKLDFLGNCLALRTARPSEG